MAKPYAHPAGRRAIQDHMNRIGMQNEVVEFEGLPGSNRIRPALRETPMVSIIMPTAGRLRVVHGMRTNLVVHAVRSIVQRTTYPNYEIVVVADTDTPDATVAELREVAGDRVRVVPFPGAFNYSAKINLGAFHARGEYLLTLNDDIEVLARGWKDRSLDDVGPSDWLECLLGYATHPDIGSVGAKMYLGDRRLQHVGIISTSGSVPAHPYRGFHGGFLGYIGNAIMPCNYIAVTGACLMTRRAVFDEVGGMSAAFPINYQDVDYGLKLRAKGYRTVYNPEVELFHFESSSRAPDVADAERALLRARWGKILAQRSLLPPGLRRALRRLRAPALHGRRPLHREVAGGLTPGRERPRRSSERAEPSALGPFQPPRRGRVDRGDRIDEQAFHQVLDLRARHEVRRRGREHAGDVAPMGPERVPALGDESARRPHPRPGPGVPATAVRTGPPGSRTRSRAGGRRARRGTARGHRCATSASRNRAGGARDRRARAPRPRG